MANSSMLVLPTTTASCASRRSTAVAANGETYPSSILEAHVVGMFEVHMLSFTETGMPQNGPFLSFLSTARARSTADSSMCRYACILLERARSTVAATNSSADMEPSATPAAYCSAETRRSISDLGGPYVPVPGVVERDRNAGRARLVRAQLSEAYLGGPDPV